MQAGATNQKSPFTCNAIVTGLTGRYSILA